MELGFGHWYLFPISILIATTAMASGVGGAVFFSPLFILVLQLEPAVAVGTALMTELFGFSSGLFAYCFAVGIIFLGSQLYSSLKRKEQEELDEEIRADAALQCETVLVDREGNEYRYTVARKDQGRLFAAVGGAFLGAISVGLAELQEYHLMARCRVPSPVAVATSIFVVVITVLVASLGHFYKFVISADPTILTQVASIVLFTIPGVIVGGQIGPLVQAKVDPDKIQLGIAILFIAVGVLMLTTVA